ncbi:transporter substrate-binding domain-containing protein [Shewanella sp. YLB-09]|nr:transporter substrate-binding domain-containing protein [Shewanella sp. YLB-09]
MLILSSKRTKIHLYITLCGLVLLVVKSQKIRKLKFKVLSSLLISCFFAYSVSIFAFAEEVTKFTSSSTKARSILVVGMPHLAGESDIQIQELRAYLKSYWLDWGLEYHYEIEFQPVDLLSSSKVLHGGKVDILAAAFYHPEHENDQYVSIPYVTFSGALYRQYGSSSPSKKVALHLPHTGKGFDNPFLLKQTTNFCDLITDDSEIDLIYSWAPWLASEELKKLPRGMRFQKIQKTAPNLYMRAAVSRENRELMLKINQSMRSFDSVSSIQMWQKHISSETRFFKTALGEYASDLPIELQQYVLEHPVSRYAYFDGGFPPYLIQDETHVMGYIPDLLDTIGSRTGLTFYAERFATVNQAIDAIKNQRVDLLSNLFKTPQREREMLFSQPFDNSMTVIVSNRHSQFLRFDELKDKVISAVDGTQVSKKLKLLFPIEQILLVDTMDEALLAVAEGSADAFIGNGLNASFKIHKLNLGHLSVNKPQGFENDQLYYFGINKNKLALKTLLDLGLHSVGDIELDQLHQKWVSSVLVQGADKRYETLYRTVSTTGLVVILLALFLGTAIKIYLTNLRKTKLEVVNALALAEKSREHAEVLARAKTDFLARMSHEIRTPMNGVLGMAEALSYTKLSLEQKDLLDTLNGSAQNLMALLNDVLDFSKMDAGKLTVEQTPSNLDGLLTNVINNFRHKAKYAGLELNLRVDEQLSDNYLTDPTRVMQLLNNLISNSIKFTSSGFIELSAQLLAVDSCEPNIHTIRIDVRDTGIGIEPEKIATLFDPFTQAEGDTTRRFGGTGLGLSICKEITEALGGEVKVTSMPGKGSLFSIVLNLVSTEEVGILQGTANDDIDHILQCSSFSNLSILLAEDNPVNRKVIGGQLARLGLEVDLAENGLIAYQMYQQGNYDIIISDCHMPEMDGFALADKVNSEREGSRPRIIAITADALSGAEQSCLSAGFDNYIAKPCPLDILQQKLTAEILLLPAQESRCLENYEQLIVDREEIYGTNDFVVHASHPTEVDGDTSGLVIAEHNLIPEPLDTFPTVMLAEERGHPTNMVNPEDRDEICTHFNAEHLLELSGDDQDIATDILDVYLSGADEDLQQLEALVIGLEFHLLKDLAHRVKGSLRYLGALELGDISQCLELACVNEDIDSVESLVSELVKGLQQVKLEVSVWLQKEVG